MVLLLGPSFSSTRIALAANSFVTQKKQNGTANVPQQAQRSEIEAETKFKKESHKRVEFTELMRQAEREKNEVSAQLARKDRAIEELRGRLREEAGHAGILKSENEIRVLRRQGKGSENAGPNGDQIG